MDIFENLQQIKIERPSDKIIGQIKALISSGQLKPGDRLPSERKLSEKFGVGRGYVREAIQKLEFYGILRTLPQSGTLVAGLGVTALEGLINDVLQLNQSDFHSLVETRVILEINAAKLAAERANDAELRKISQALEAFNAKVESGEEAVEEDLMFHLKIAEASENSVLKSLLLIIVPDLINYTKTLKICADDRPIRSMKEHQEIFDEIVSGNSEGAGKAMRTHLKDVLEYRPPNDLGINGNS
ncbi:FadR/GntR family transcriptional regulator [Fulvivirgaceae bacterium BMA12]|uniref:FadR/GntR family transcriptional regulator n=1 Tax=Agaribacillus aureus TaxID=3051825 RepID=A0ABT8LAV1_9BACT|nr:FadR/GntR family transcriptional regulator [Fulvivirgaceae bacterium BMA12]